MTTMRLQSLGTVLLADHPAQAAQFYRQHLGFQPVAELDWYVSLQHPDLPNLFLDLIGRDHPASAESLRGQPTSGVLFGFVVDDVQAEEKRLRLAGVTLTKELTDEPWGQRRFQVAAPDGVVVEILQRIPPDPEWLRQQGG